MSKVPTDADWKEFQSLMAFIDHLQGKGIFLCRRPSKQEAKHGWPEYSFVDIRRTAWEKMVRRYIGLPSEDLILKELDSELARIRQRNEADREIEQTKEAFRELPGITNGKKS